MTVERFRFLPSSVRSCVMVRLEQADQTNLLFGPFRPWHAPERCTRTNFQRARRVRGAWQERVQVGGKNFLPKTFSNV
jgi:hypothetical protein